MLVSMLLPRRTAARKFRMTERKSFDQLDLKTAGNFWSWPGDLAGTCSRIPLYRPFPGMRRIPGQRKCQPPGRDAAGGEKYRFPIERIESKILSPAPKFHRRGTFRRDCGLHLSLLREVRLTPSLTPSRRRNDPGERLKASSPDAKKASIPGRTGRNSRSMRRSRKNARYRLKAPASAAQPAPGPDRRRGKTLGSLPVRSGISVRSGSPTDKPPAECEWAFLRSAESA